MKVTKIRHIDGDKVEFYTLSLVQADIRAKMARAGFITDVTIVSNTQMKIGLHMRSFKIDTQKLGHNADTSTYARKCKAGFKRTDVPTWDQRVEFNNIVNWAFNRHALNAKITSGNLLIRDFETGAVRSWDMDRFVNERAYYEICKISELEPRS